MAASCIRCPMATPAVDVVPTHWSHLRLIAAGMREQDRAEALAIGMAPERALWRSYTLSMFAHTCFVDGKAAAVFGLVTNLLDDVGAPWLATTPEIERVKLSFVRYARAEVGLMLTVRPRLVNFVDARYDRAQRFLEAIGFTLDAPAPYGPNGEMFRRFERCA